MLLTKVPLYTKNTAAYSDLVLLRAFAKEL